MILHPNVKVNLGLDVLRKRPDGYHDLNTLFVPYFGISDTLEIISGDDFSRTSAELFSRYDSSSIRQSVSADDYHSERRRSGLVSAHGFVRQSVFPA